MQAEQEDAVNLQRFSIGLAHGFCQALSPGWMGPCLQETGMIKGIGGSRRIRLTCPVRLQLDFQVVPQQRLPQRDFRTEERDFKGQEVLRHAARKPQRITVTIPQAVYESLGELSFREGRSMSNLASFMLERAIRAQL